MTGKWKSKYSIFQSAGEKQHMALKRKEIGTIWELSHVCLRAIKKGTEGGFLSIPLVPQRAVAEKFFYRKSKLQFLSFIKCISSICKYSQIKLIQFAQKFSKVRKISLYSRIWD